ncbi:MAG: nuclear transport factor 2 family protein [Blastocatellia bacterium]
MNPSDVTDTKQPALQRQISELQDQARRAFLAQDIDALSLILFDDFIVNSPIGRILTKRETLDLLQRVGIRHFSYEEHIEHTVRHGDIVIVMGHDAVTRTT